MSSDIIQAAWGEGHPDVGTVKYKQGDLLVGIGKLQPAEEAYAAAL